MPATRPAFDYDTSDVHLRYAEARHLAPHTVAMWLDAIGRHVPRADVRTIVDLGCGTGRFSAALGGYFSARVIAVDPSRNMLSVAATAANERLAFVQARADHLPLRDDCADLLFASMVWHHIPDKHIGDRSQVRKRAQSDAVGIRGRIAGLRMTQHVVMRQLEPAVSHRFRWRSQSRL